MTRTAHQVAVVVFATVEGVDEHDAGAGLEIAVRTALAGESMALPVMISRQMRDFTIEAEVSEVMEVGQAAGNGYLWTRPTGRAFPERM